jgi:hypothetical protein
MKEAVIVGLVMAAMIVVGITITCIVDRVSPIKLVKNVWNDWRESRRTK